MQGVLYLQYLQGLYCSKLVKRPIRDCFANYSGPYMSVCSTRMPPKPKTPRVSKTLIPATIKFYTRKPCRKAFNTNPSEELPLSGLLWTDWALQGHPALLGFAIWKVSGFFEVWRLGFGRQQFRATGVLRFRVWGI